ncbi:hypothetical protein WJX73_003944 [Symbiochloris irregularis]|uniref:Uncharacterized protein n=1 Tax=Symbiochloris irregularis TaxID=706552 RepID=A0AAW1P9I8_9CHLO
MQQATSVYLLHQLTQLTSITNSGPAAYIPDLLPLKGLPCLRKLHLGEVDLGKAPCLHQLTQLKDLAILGDLQDLHIEHLAALSALRTLDLSNSRLPHFSGAHLLTLGSVRLLMLLKAYLKDGSIGPDWKALPAAEMLTRGIFNFFDNPFCEND